MQGSMVATSTVVERPLRRITSVRGAISDLQMHLDFKSPLNHSSPIQRQDSKFEKPSPLGPPPSTLPGLLTRNDSIAKLCDICHANTGGPDSSCTCGILVLPRRLHSAEQAARKTRVLATCCISGVLSLFLFLQIVSGGFGVFSNPLMKVSSLSQIPSALKSDVQINVLREDSYTESDILGKYWRPLPTPLKQIANRDSGPRDGQPVQAIRNGHHQSASLPEKLAKSSRTGQQVTNFQAAYDTGPPIPVRDEQVRGDSKAWKTMQLPVAQGLVDPSLPSGQASATTPSHPIDVAKMRLRDPGRGGKPFDQSAALDQAKWDRYPWAMPLSSGKLKQCMEPSATFQKATEETNGYIVMFANGGLNQMRTAICDVVAVAWVLNATLVIPELDHTSYWADPSDFGKVFDVENFIQTLQDDVKVVNALPEHLQSHKIFELAPRSWSEASYYEDEILPLLKEHGVIRFALTDSRLANNRIDREIQRLRCRANYRALTFHPTIQDLANKIVGRLNSRGPFIALHLRYEKDMLAFSGCSFGLSSLEARELRSIRYNVTRWKEKEIDPVQRRAEGLCPLTPREIGLMLKAMGYPRSTLIYVAAGQIYGGERRMKVFTSFFPNVVTKETLASKEELSPFKDYQNRMAALDYMVAIASDVFVPTYDGNMARAVQGHRRFVGHKRTLMPDRIELVKLFDSYHNGELDWSSLRRQVHRTHRNRQGSHHERKPLSPSRVKQEENFYANPTECFCRTDVASTPVPILQRRSRHL